MLTVNRPNAAVLTAAMLTMGAGVGAEPPARLEAYTWRAPAHVNTKEDAVSFPGTGMFRISTDSPLVGFHGIAALSNGTILLESGEGRRYEIGPKGESNKPVEFSISFPQPIKTMALVVMPRGKENALLRQARFEFADGSRISLSDLLVGEYHKLGPHNRLDRYEEPPTARLSTAAAQAVIEADWQEQKAGQPWAHAIADETRRLERMIARQASRLSPETLADRRQRLSAIRRAAADLEQTWRALRRWKRACLLGDPEIDFDRILCIDVPYAGDHQTSSRNAHSSVVGGRLLALDGLGPDSPVRKLAPRDGAMASAFWRPDVSYDGKKTLFCMRAGSGPKDIFHLYEMNLDGSGLRQITEGDYDDYDPVYAPDGGIVFSTTRCNQFLPCGSEAHRMFVLARCDEDGRNIYFLSSNHESDYHPALLPDGRILYTRWEYYDKSVSRLHCLWTVNSDGTGSATYWGNQSTWPDIVWNARPIPGFGGSRALFASAGHHDPFSGSLGIVDVREGLNYPHGLWTLTPDVPWVEVGRGPDDRVYNPDFPPPSCYRGFLTPFPFSENLFLVSARTGYAASVGQEPDLRFHGLYLMDYDGNMELLYTGAFNILHAQPIRPRQKPPALASSVKWPGRMTRAEQRPADGVFYSADVYEGTTLPRGKVKSLRVMDADSRTFGAMRGLDYGPKMGRPYVEQKAMPSWDIVTAVPLSFVYADSTKRVLGVVPVEEDGSVNFFAPPLRTLYFQLLDENGLCLQTMRSAVHVMPGEYRGCVGCHETRPVAPVADTASSIALRRGPSKIEPPPWGDASVSFPRFVQPVLDRNCVFCHNSEKSSGGFDFMHRAEDPLDFSWPYVKLVFGNWSPGRDVRDTTIANPIFPALTYPNPEVKFPTRETVVPPMTAMSYNSRLIRIATSGEHYGAKVSPREAQQLIAWVDALCVYNGLEEILTRPDPNPRNSGSYPFASKMMNAPMVHKAFAQDEFKTQDDRIPKDADGKPSPSIEIINGKRIYRLPETKNAK